MADWPAQYAEQDLIVISTGGLASIGLELWQQKVNAVATAWPTANKAFFVPFLVRSGFTVAKITWLNGGTVNNNVDVGVYDAQGNRLVSIGSTAQTGASAVQTVDVTDTALKPGVYYAAMALDGTTGTVALFTAANRATAAATGVLCQTTAFALPSTATFAAMDASSIPWLLLSGRVLI